jgi:MFS family permease
MLLAFVLNETSRSEVTTTFLLACFIISIILLIRFYFVEKKAKHPLVEFSFYKKNPYLLITLIRILNIYASFAIMFILPLYFQNILDMSPVQAGLMILIMVAMYVILSPFMGKWLDKAGYKKPLIISVTTGLLACVFIANLNLTLNLWILIIGFLLFGLSKGIMLPCSVGIALNNLPKAKAGAGLGMFYSLSFLGGICGVAITGAIISFLSFHKVITGISKFGFNLTADKLAIVKKVASGAMTTSHLKLYFTSAQVDKLLPLVKNGFIFGFSISIWLIVLLSFISLILAFFVTTNSTKNISKT